MEDFREQAPGNSSFMTSDGEKAVLFSDGSQEQPNRFLWREE